MKAKAIIESLFEADPNDYLKSLGIVRQSPAPPAPALAPTQPTPASKREEPDDETKMALKGDILNDLPDEPDFEEMDGQDLLDAWTDACLGGRRIRYNNIDELINAIGYEDLEEFFQDNEGAVDSLQDWIVEWLEKSKRFGDDGWWAKMVQAIRDARSEQD